MTASASAKPLPFLTVRVPERPLPLQALRTRHSRQGRHAGLRRWLRREWHWVLAACLLLAIKSALLGFPSGPAGGL